MDEGARVIAVIASPLAAKKQRVNEFWKSLHPIASMARKPEAPWLHLM
jgi:hypothetical protein